MKKDKLYFDALAAYRRGVRLGWDQVVLSAPIFPETIEGKPGEALEFHVNQDKRGSGVTPSEIARFFLRLPDESGHADWPHFGIQLPQWDDEAEQVFAAHLMEETHLNARCVTIEPFDRERFLLALAAIRYGECW